MNFEKFCKRCQHYEFDFQKGILCGLTSQKPSFVENCDKFELDPERDKITTDKIARTSHSEYALPELSASLRKWGIGLIALGTLHLVFTNFLDPVWGTIIIVLGVINLVVKKRGMFIANGVALILVGLLNIVGTIVPEGPGLGWLVFGALQLAWGAQEIRKFKLYGESEIQLEPAVSKSVQVGGTEGLDQVKLKHSGMGIASTILSTTAFLIQMIVLTTSFFVQAVRQHPLDEESRGAIMIGLLMILSAILILVGLGLAVAGLFQKNRKRAFSVSGLVMGLILLLGLLLLLLLGSSNPAG